MIPCHACNTKLYPLERMTLNSLVFHKTGCAKCSVCKSNLTPQNFAQMGDAMYCRVHYMQQFSRSGGRYEPAAEAPRAAVPTKPAAAAAAVAAPKNFRAPPPIPQSMLARQQQQQSKPANRLSAFLNQHSSPEPVAAPVTAPVPVSVPAPAERMLEPAQPAKLSAFLGKTSLKDIRLAKQQQQQPSAQSSSSSSLLSSSSSSSSSRGGGANALFKERMSAFTTAQQSKPPQPQQHVVGGGLSLKDRLRAYTSAATASSPSVSSSSHATSTPLGQRMQTYRQATSKPQVPTALIVHDDDDDDDQENAPSNPRTHETYREMLRVCVAAQASLASLRVDAANIKQQQVYSQLHSEVNAWVTRLDSLV